MRYLLYLPNQRDSHLSSMQVAKRSCLPDIASVVKHPSSSSLCNVRFSHSFFIGANGTCANKKSARAWALLKWRIAMQLIGDLQKGHAAAESFAVLKHAGEFVVSVAGDHGDQDHDDGHHQKGGQARFAAFETALNLRTDLEQEHAQ